MIELPLRNRVGVVMAVAVVDDDDGWVSDYRWYRHRNGYAVRSVRDSIPHTRQMHREILRVTNPRIHIDHRNHDGLDNRRSNLRIGTPALNGQNRKRQVGVSFHKRRGTWNAFGVLEGKQIHLGIYADREAAQLAANQWRSTHYPFFLKGESLVH